MKSVHILAATISLMMASPASAALLGKEFTADYYVPNAATPYDQGSFTPSPFVVGAGVETVGNIENVTFLSTNFGDQNLRIDFSTLLNSPRLNDATFSGPIFTSTTLLGITGFTLNASTNLTGFDADRVLITNYGIGLNLEGLSYVTGSVVAVDFAFGREASAIPEPATWALMIIGFGALGSTVRASRRKDRLAKP
ncbi:MAG: PEPxxWA-CTERM sorting domain-containing protein [Elusimicrobiota bacterium]|nr:PEPxxWA-CTERM sorting domain-containing protein [Elusimicrobiota bacterium]